MGVAWFMARVRPAKPGRIRSSTYRCGFKLQTDSACRGRSFDSPRQDAGRLAGAIEACSVSPGSQPPYFLTIPDHHVSRRRSDVEAIAAVDQGPLVRVLDPIDIQHQKVVATAAEDLGIDETPALGRKEQIGLDPV